jgi:outer membrane protein assembly factor BamB
MRILRTISVLGAAISCLSAAGARADDWAQWRGPQRTGISRETGLLKEWPKEGPKLVWQIKDIGGGLARRWLWVTRST